VPKLIACLDVGYKEQYAIAACVAISEWTDMSTSAECAVRIEAIQEYKPGEFYTRALPCLMSVLDKLDCDLRCVVIDGYVWLDASRRPGLGSHLFEALGQQIPVIGVAKTAFKGSEHALALLRGNSSRPLYITSVGIAKEAAAAHIASMHGENRMPSVLKRVDQLSRVG